MYAMAPAPIRILQVINSSEEGGGANHLQALVSHLDRHSFVSLVATTDHGPMVARLEAADVKVVDVDMMRSRVDLRPVVRLRKLIRAADIDLVHLHGTRAGFFGTLALSTLRPRPRAIYTVHGLSCNRKAGSTVKRFFAGVERFIAARVDRVISVSDIDRRFGVEQGILPADRTASIPNGIAVNGAGPPPQIRPERLRVVTVARLVPQKGIPVLLQAARRVRDRFPEAEFTILGDGPDRAALEAQARRLGIGDGVVFAGATRNASSRLGEFDLFVLPSLWEGMPISLLEAMAAARPVVATSVSGSRELVLDGETGRLVPPGDPEALAQAILELATDPALAASMARAGRDRARRNYSIDRMVDSTVEIYRELLEADS